MIPTKYYSGGRQYIFADIRDDTPKRSNGRYNFIEWYHFFLIPLIPSCVSLLPDNNNYIFIYLLKSTDSCEGVLHLRAIPRLALEKVIGAKVSQI